MALPIQRRYSYVPPISQVWTATIPTRLGTKWRQSVIVPGGGERQDCSNGRPGITSPWFAAREALARSANRRRKTLPVSDVTVESSSPLSSTNLANQPQDDERPPSCPKCSKRLVILATHSVRDENGSSVRQQLWGCPRGHSTATRRGGAFGPVTMLAELVG